MRNPRSPMQTMLFHSGVYKFNRLSFHRIDFLSLYQWNTEEELTLRSFMWNSMSESICTRHKDIVELRIHRFHK